MVATRTIGSFSGASVAVAILVVLSITVPGTYSIVVVIWTVSAADVAVSRVILKVLFLLGGSTVSVWIFLFMGRSLVLALHLFFCRSMKFLIVRA